MHNARLAMAACLLGGFAWSVSSVPAAAGAAMNLMGRVPSVAELAAGLMPPPQSRTRGLTPSQATAAEAIRPAVDLDVRFEFDSAELTPMAQAVLDNLATALTTDLAPYRFVLEGHTDAVGNDGYNLELSERRAHAVERYLRDLYRIDPERLTTIGKGERELLLPEQPAAASNRRVRVINRG
ncbi:MAG TPA: OmpA family protein [Geminicoccaceae bacterium]|nr:OmpA family protein [Geminicoccaceae bacterium]